MVGQMAEVSDFILQCYGGFTIWCTWKKGSDTSTRAFASQYYRNKKT